MTDMNPPTTAAQTVTPLTDAAEFSATTWSKIVGEETHAVVYGDFARHLETDLSSALAQLRQAREQNETMRTALERLRECDWIISLPDRMDAVRDIARSALTTTAPKEKETK